MRLGEVLGLAAAELADLYYLSLLAMLGCTADAHRAAAAFGDELVFGSRIVPVAMGGPGEVLGWMLRHFAADQPPVRRARALARAMAAAPRMMAEAGTAHARSPSSWPTACGSAPGSARRSAACSSGGTARAPPAA